MRDLQAQIRELNRQLVIQQRADLVKYNEERAREFSQHMRNMALGTKFRAVQQKFFAMEPIEGEEAELVRACCPREGYVDLQEIVMLREGYSERKHQSDVKGDLPNPRDPPQNFPSQWSRNG